MTAPLSILGRFPRNADVAPLQPVGYIEISAAGMRFRRIVDADTIVAMAAAAALLLLVVRRLWTTR